MIINKISKFFSGKYLLLIILFAAILRFGGLNWAFPYNPHPDEWNMAIAISRLTPNDSYNPHFFAYGQFPLYLSYFSARIYNLIPWISIEKIDIKEAIFFLRFYSAIASILTVGVIYLISRKLLNKHLAISASLLAAFTPGMIQNAHFGTTEAILTLMFCLTVYLSLKLSDQFKIKTLLLAGISLGIAVGSKLSGLAFGLPIFIVFLWELSNSIREKKSRQLFLLPFMGILFLGITTVTIFITSPHLLLSYKDSLSTLRYETSVATGDSPVFYTRQYIKTIPIIFHFTKIFPYALGWPILIVGSIGLLLAIVAVFNPKGVKKKRTYWFVFVVSFLGYFLSQAFLFAKWTRFVAPIFPFFPIFALFVWHIVQKEVKNIKLFRLLITVYCLLVTIPAIYFFSIYLKPDIRFAASDWIYKNIPSGSALLYDTGNVMDIPVVPPNSKYQVSSIKYHTTSFDFYELDENDELLSKLIDELAEVDYIVVPSRRVFINHMRFPDKYPLVNNYFEALFNGKLGFAHIKTFLPLPQLTIPAQGWSTLGGNNKFRISGIPNESGQLTYFSDEQAEETWSVFDHPVIRIYQKQVGYTKDQYYKILTAH